MRDLCTLEGCNFNFDSADVVCRPCVLRSGALLHSFLEKLEERLRMF